MWDLVGPGIWDWRSFLERVESVIRLVLLLAPSAGEAEGMRKGMRPWALGSPNVWTTVQLLGAPASTASLST